LLEEISEDSICPSCGRFETLVEQVGFCHSCCVKLSICPFCGKQEARVAIAGKCNYCARNRWFINNANAVEDYMRAGLTYNMAVVKVMFDNRPSCFCCGNKIKGGRKDKDLFCTANAECKRQARYYKFLLLNKSKSKQEALDIISERLRKKGMVAQEHERTTTQQAELG
jgi:hypothetical protein